LGAGAVNGEEIHLSDVVAACPARAKMVSVATADVEDDGAAAKPPGLALNAGQRGTVVDCEVVATVLAERRQHEVSGVSKDEHDREGRAVTDALRMLHSSELAEALG
jgi:hypothetical protein